MPITFATKGIIPRSFTGPGDLGVPFTMFWGMRAFSNQSGNRRVLRLRRTDNNSESDFNLAGNHIVDESGISTWAAGNTTAITTFYDQLTETYNVTQPTNANQTFYTPNILTGHGVSDSTMVTPGGVQGVYKTPTLFDWATFGGISGYAVFNSTDTTYHFDDIGNSVFNEYTLICSGDIFPHDHLSIVTKNEGSSDPGGTQIPLVDPGTLNAWYAAGSYFDFVDVGNNSFSNFNNTFQSALVDRHGNPSGGDFLNGHGTFSEIFLLGDQNPQNWPGYLVECGLYISPLASPAGWSPAQLTSVIANAKSFWGV